MADKIKYTVALPKSVADALEELSTTDSMSKPEILRRAIALYYRLYFDVIKGKSRLCLVDDNNNMKEFIFS